jgi:hypothetical protein
MQYQYKPFDEGSWAGVALALGTIAGLICLMLGAPAEMSVPVGTVVTGLTRPLLAFLVSKIGAQPLPAPPAPVQ